MDMYRHEKIEADSKSELQEKENIFRSNHPIDPWGTTIEYKGFDDESKKYVSIATISNRLD